MMEERIDVFIVGLLLIVSIGHNLFAWWFWKRVKLACRTADDLRESARDLLIATQKLVNRENE